MATPFVPRQNVDFIVTSLYDQFHWESTGRIFGNAFCNEDPFDLPENAAVNAIEELSGVTDLDLALTEEEQAELDDKIALLPQADVQDLRANVQCLPQRYQERSFYAQIMLTPVPEYLQMGLL